VILCIEMRQQMIKNSKKLNIVLMYLCKLNVIIVIKVRKHDDNIINE
jgi:hypothetical protein